jgi:hypothetical protein
MPYALKSNLFLHYFGLNPVFHAMALSFQKLLKSFLLIESILLLVFQSLDLRPVVEFRVAIGLTAPAFFTDT